MSGGLGSVEDVLNGIEHARRAGLDPDQDQRGHPARHERSHGARSDRALPRHRRHRALHRVHGRRQPQSLGAGARRALERAGGAHRRTLAARAAASANYRGEVAERYGVQGRPGRSRLHLLGDAALLRRLFTRAGCRPTACCTPACSPRRARACATRCAVARATTQLLEIIRNVWTEARRPLQRAARRPATFGANAAEGRDVLHRRLIAWQLARQSARTRGHGLTHLDASNRPTMVDVGAKEVTHRVAEAEARITLPRNRCTRAARRAATARRRARCSTRRSSRA